MFQKMGPAPSGRSGHAMVACGAKIFVLGGESNTASSVGTDPNNVHVLDTSTFLMLSWPRLKVPVGHIKYPSK